MCLGVNKSPPCVFFFFFSSPLFFSCVWIPSGSDNYPTVMLHHVEALLGRSTQLCSENHCRTLDLKETCFSKRNGFTLSYLKIKKKDYERRRIWVNIRWRLPTLLAQIRWKSNNSIIGSRKITPKVPFRNPSNIRFKLKLKMLRHLSPSL